MTGVNTSGSASGDNVLLGRGRLYFAELDSNDLPGPYRDLGNATDFQVTTGSETLDRKNFRTGLAVIDKKIVIEQSVSLNFTLDELTFDNLALFFSGEAFNGGYTSPNNTSLAAAALGVTVQDAIGKWIELRNGSGDRLYNLGAYDAAATPAAGAFNVFETTGAVVIPAANVEVNLRLGLFRILDTYTPSTPGDPLRFQFTAASGGDTTLDQMRGLTKSSLQGALKFVSENPANNDEQVEYQFHKVTLLADGEMSLIGDELATIPITGQVEQNVAADADSGFVTITGDFAS